MALSAYGGIPRKGDFVYPSNSDDSDFEGTVRSSPDVTSEIFDRPPPVPFSSDSETEIVEENENNPNANEPNSYGLQETPMYNYSGDHENEEDFQDGWYWAYLPNEEDTGPEYGPFIGKQQLLLDPRIKDPEYFFHKMFSPTMFDAIAESTNRYVSLCLRVQNAVPAQPCAGKLGISLVLLNFLHCNFRLWFKTP